MIVESSIWVGVDRSWNREFLPRFTQYFQSAKLRRICIYKRNPAATRARRVNRAPCGWVGHRYATARASLPGRWKKAATRACLLRLSRGGYCSKKEWRRQEALGISSSPKKVRPGKVK